MSSQSIRLSERHGVNPCLVQCFVCGETDSIALLGRLPGDKKAPRAVLSKDPCAKCREWMKKGVILIAVRDGEKGDNPYRTGGWCVVTDDAFSRIFGKSVTTKIAFVEDKAWDLVGLPRSTTNGQEVKHSKA